MVFGVCDMSTQQGKHWVLGVMNLLEESIEFYDSMGGSDRGAMVGSLETPVRYNVEMI